MHIDTARLVFKDARDYPGILGELIRYCDAHQVGLGAMPGEWPVLKNAIIERISEQGDRYVDPVEQDRIRSITRDLAEGRS